MSIQKSTVMWWLVVGLIIVAAGIWQRRSRAPSAQTPDADAYDDEHGPDEFFDLKGNDAYAVAAVGESHYQPALRSIVGKRDAYVALHFTAHLVCEDDNRYDKNAVRVLVRGKRVGYLSREVAPVYRKIIRDAGFGRATGRCQAKVLGGSADKPSYGVWLDIRPLLQAPTR